MKVESIYLEKTEKYNVLIASIFFVIGFSFVFSFFGILLQTILSGSSQMAMEWVARVSGVIIIIFGFLQLGLFVPKFLQSNHNVKVSEKFTNIKLKSFIFGAAFATSWTPCVSAALGAILALAASNASGAFLLLFAYSLGLGLPFILMGIFIDRTQSLIDMISSKIKYLQYFFAILLIVLGMLVFTRTLGLISNFESIALFLNSLSINTKLGANIFNFNFINIIVAFVGGVISFLSPCILPIIPPFITYLATTATNKKS